MTIALASAAVACGPASLTRQYSGIASVQAAGQPTLALEHQTATITSCEVPRDSDSGRAYATFAVVTIGGQCEIAGAWEGGTFRARTAGDCTLPMPGHEITLHVTDVVVRRAMAGTRYGRAPDDSWVDVQIGGTAATGSSASGYLVYHLSGTLGETTDGTHACAEWLARAEPNAMTLRELGR